MRPLATISTLFLAANLLNARSVITDTLYGKPKTVDTTPGDVTIRFDAQLMTNPIQNLVLDPLRVIRIPVSRDRVTTVRFPSPISDFVSAAIATEPHPEAKFLLLPQPGRAFFSLQALATNASTTLNVVWKSQTIVLEIVESSNPWLAVSFSAPESTQASRPNSKRKASSPTSVWLQFIDTAKGIHNQQSFPVTNYPDVVFLRTKGQVYCKTYSFDIQEALMFGKDEILVLRVVFLNHSNEVLRFDPSGTTFAAEGRAITYLASDSDGVVTTNQPTVAYFVARAPKYEPRNSSGEDSIHVTFPRLEGVSQDSIGTVHFPVVYRVRANPTYTNYQHRVKW